MSFQAIFGGNFFGVKNTVWKLWKFTLTLYWQKFRENNIIKLFCKSISRIIFQAEHYCFLQLSQFHKVVYDFSHQKCPTKNRLKGHDKTTKVDNIMHVFIQSPALKGLCRQYKVSHVPHPSPSCSVSQYGTIPLRPLWIRPMKQKTRRTWSLDLQVQRLT